MQRRTLLRGLGTAMALPWLESLSPQRAQAAGSAEHPGRMVFVYAPNGVIKDQWTPADVGNSYELSPTLQPLHVVKDDLIVFTNLSRRRPRSRNSLLPHRRTSVQDRWRGDSRRHLG